MNNIMVYVKDYYDDTQSGPYLVISTVYQESAKEVRFVLLDQPSGRFFTASIGYCTYTTPLHEALKE